MLKTCSVDGCKRQEKTRGWCGKHYHRVQRHNDPLHEPKTVLERFEGNVELIPFSTCHWWIGCFDNKGYGAASLKSKYIGAHRLSYILYKGEIPEGMVVRHTCHESSCVNPAHLITGTQKQNIYDSMRAGRHTKGEGHGMSVLTEVDVLRIREIAKTMTYVGLSELFPVTATTIRLIVRREAWKHVP